MKWRSVRIALPKSAVEHAVKVEPVGEFELKGIYGITLDREWTEWAANLGVSPTVAAALLLIVGRCQDHFPRLGRSTPSRGRSRIVSATCTSACRTASLG